MDFNIDVRKKQLENLEQLVSSSGKRIQSVLSYLGWTSESVEKEDPLVQCPFNGNHRILPESWNKHVGQCMLKMEGYSLKEEFLSESSDNPSQSIYLDRNKKIELITKELADKGTLRLVWNGLEPDPRTSDRLMSTFSADERLIFYNYVIDATVGPPPPSEFVTHFNNKLNEEKQLSYEELLAQERDAKRRRAKYKSVHINRKNHTEVIREVINGQMEEYKDWLLSHKQKNEKCNNGSCDEKKVDHERPHSSTSRNSSSSRSTSRKYDRDRVDKTRYRDRSPRGSHRNNNHSERRWRSSERRDRREKNRQRR